MVIRVLPEHYHVVMLSIANPHKMILMHILLIEDDGDAAAYLSKGLVECGHSVDHADNGDDGLHMPLSSE